MRPRFAEALQAKVEVPGVPTGVGIDLPILKPPSIPEAGEVAEVAPAANGLGMIGDDVAIPPPVIGAFEE